MASRNRKGWKKQSEVTVGWREWEKNKRRETRDLGSCLRAAPASSFTVRRKSKRFPALYRYPEFYAYHQNHCTMYRTYGEFSLIYVYCIAGLALGVRLLRGNFDFSAFLLVHPFLHFAIVALQHLWRAHQSHFTMLVYPEKSRGKALNSCKLVCDVHTLPASTSGRREKERGKKAKKSVEWENERKWKKERSGSPR